MKTIPYIPDITLQSFDGSPIPAGVENPLSQKRFMMMVLVDPKFASSMESIMTAIKIRDQLTNLDSQKEFTIEDSDWVSVKSVIEKPINSWNPLIAHCLIPFMKAITEAK